MSWACLCDCVSVSRNVLTKFLFPLRLWFWSTFTNTHQASCKQKYLNYGLHTGCLLFKKSEEYSLSYTVNFCKLYFPVLLNFIDTSCDQQPRVAISDSLKWRDHHTTFICSLWVKSSHTESCLIAEILIEHFPRFIALIQGHCTAINWSFLEILQT